MPGAPQEVHGMYSAPPPPSMEDKPFYASVQKGMLVMGSSDGEVAYFTGLGKFLDPVATPDPATQNITVTISEAWLDQYIVLKSTNAHQADFKLKCEKADLQQLFIVFKRYGGKGDHYTFDVINAAGEAMTFVPNYASKNFGIKVPALLRKIQDQWVIGVNCPEDTPVMSVGTGPLQSPPTTSPLTYPSAGTPIISPATPLFPKSVSSTEPKASV